MKKGHGIGFGKAILFNEHFVVYGIPSIVSAIGNYTVAKVEAYDKPGFKLADKRPATPKYKEDKLGQQKESFELMFKKMGVDLSKKGVSITLKEIFMQRVVSVPLLHPVSRLPVRLLSIST